MSCIFKEKLQFFHRLSRIVKVILLAPTGVSALNILRATINSGPLLRTSDQDKCKTRNLYSELEVIMVYEISMVSDKMLFNVHRRLCEIFGCNGVDTFAGKTVLLLGDLLQLSPAKLQQVFKSLISLIKAMCKP